MQRVVNYPEKYKALSTKEFPQLQDKAIAHFSRLGFPTTKDEEWKYTNIAELIAKDFSFVFPERKISREEILNRFPFLQNAFYVIIENGRLNSEATDLNNLPNGIEIKNIREAKNSSLVQKHFNQYADVGADAFAALNTAFANEGLFVHVQQGISVEKPVYIVHISSSTDQAAVAHNRLLIAAEKNSSVKILNVAVSKNNSSDTFSNSVNEIFVDENARVEFNVLQNENNNSFHICGTHVLQSKNSVFSINTISLGGKIIRNKLHIKLDGSNSENHMYGLYLAGNSQLIDNHTAVYHAMPHCNSNQLYKGIIGGKAHGVFNGKVVVEKDAQKTNAYQSNKNILLSNDAVVNAKPQLEIFADDVKCSHGATTGQMDDDALFYLRARGIGEESAKALLNIAFANDVLNNISVAPFREYVSALVESKLKETLQ